MKKKMMKAIKDLNAYIDNDRQKLCDELHEVKLSHKRLERLLKYSKGILNAIHAHCELPEPVTKDLISLVIKIEQELAYPYLRRNWGYTHKQEPGHYCDN